MLFRASSCVILLGLSACSPQMPSSAINNVPSPNSASAPQRTATGSELPQAHSNQPIAASPVAPGPSSQTSTPRTTAPVRAAPRQDRAVITRFERAVAKGMRDPESTRFEDSRLVYNDRGRLALCGSINAKNAFGGYVGFQTFFADVFCVNDRECVAFTSLSRSLGFEAVSEKCRTQFR
jgi:hypothetical protein